MDTRIFAVVIGVDQYKSGDIWNLQSCVDDAKSIKRWLVDDLGVPKHQIAMLLDERATKQNIEVTLDTHLLHNSRIQRGDAILIYFAGHGSALKAPHDWLLDRPTGRCDVQVLCPYDHDTKGTEGRIAGISARAMYSFIRDLCKAKGNNITLMIDSCFTPHSRDRSCVRWTSTSKAVAEDLYSGHHLCPNLQKRNESFYSRNWTTHIVITASKPGTTAMEGKEGGKFTSAFLKVMRFAPLHDTPFATLMDEICREMGPSQIPYRSGAHSDHLFNAVQDLRYIPVEFHDEKAIRIEIGSQHGIEKGRQFSLHAHNYSSSRNPAIATVTVQAVHPSYCIGLFKSSCSLPKSCWARAPHHHALSYASIRKTLQALLHAATYKSCAPSVSRSVSISDIKGAAGKSELIETAEALLAAQPLLASLMK